MAGILPRSTFHPSTVMGLIVIVAEGYMWYICLSIQPENMSSNALYTEVKPQTWTPQLVAQLQLRQ